MSRSEEFDSGRASEDTTQPGMTPEEDTAWLKRNGKVAEDHKGRSGYFESHNSGRTYTGACPKCRGQAKAGNHPMY